MEPNPKPVGINSRVLAFRRETKANGYVTEFDDYTSWQTQRLLPDELLILCPDKQKRWFKPVVVDSLTMTLRSRDYWEANLLRMTQTSGWHLTNDVNYVPPYCFYVRLNETTEEVATFPMPSRIPDPHSWALGTIISAVFPLWQNTRGRSAMLSSYSLMSEQGVQVGLPDVQANAIYWCVLLPERNAHGALVRKDGWKVISCVHDRSIPEDSICPDCHERLNLIPTWDSVQVENSLGQRISHFQF